MKIEIFRFNGWDLYYLSGVMIGMIVAKIFPNYSWYHATLFPLCLLFYYVLSRLLFKYLTNLEAKDK